MTSSAENAETLGVAEAKRRFSELLDRVGTGERVVVERRGRPAGILVPATEEALAVGSSAPVGLAAVAGALAEWEDLDAIVEDLYAARRSARDRPPPDLE